MRIFIALIAGLLLTGCLVPESTETNPEFSGNTVLQQLCNKEIPRLSQYGMNDVVECGNYYKKLVPEDLDDAPELMFDVNGNYVASCGGMPGVYPDFAECAIACDNLDLCLSKE